MEKEESDVQCEEDGGVSIWWRELGAEASTLLVKRWTEVEERLGNGENAAC